MLILPEDEPEYLNEGLYVQCKTHELVLKVLTRKRGHARTAA